MMPECSAVERLGYPAEGHHCRVLELKGRRVMRLSVTLLDLGSLQDKILFQMLAEPFSLSKVMVGPAYSDQKAFKKADKELDVYRSEIQAVEKRKGNTWKRTFGSG